jgi:hypothetical protein
MPLSPLQVYLSVDVCKTRNVGWAWRFKFIILATQEVEIGRIIVEGQPGQKVFKTSSQLLM